MNNTSTATRSAVTAHDAAEPRDVPSLEERISRVSRGMLSDKTLGTRQLLGLLDMPLVDYFASIGTRPGDTFSWSTTTVQLTSETTFGEACARLYEPWRDRLLEECRQNEREMSKVQQAEDSLYWDAVLDLDEESSDESAPSSPSETGDDFTDTLLPTAKVYRSFPLWDDTAMSVFGPLLLNPLYVYAKACKDRERKAAEKAGRADADEREAGQDEQDEPGLLATDSTWFGRSVRRGGARPVGDGGQDGGAGLPSLEERIARINRKRPGTSPVALIAASTAFEYFDELERLLPDPQVLMPHEDYISSKDAMFSPVGEAVLDAWGKDAAERVRIATALLIAPATELWLARKR